MPILPASSLIDASRALLPAVLRQAGLGLWVLGIFSGCAPLETPLDARKDSQVISSRGKPVRVLLHRELTILLPPGYVVHTEDSSEGGGSLTLHHVWRTPALPLGAEASLGISLAPFRLPYCPAAAQTAPTLTPGWQSNWRGCETSEPGVQARETFPSLEGGPVLHLFIVGGGLTEFDPLQRIAETLRWR